MSNNKIIVFVKNVILGKAKTRLAKTIGDEDALNVYVKLLEITRDQVVRLNTKKEVWYAWSVTENDMWNEKLFQKRVQIEGDLGAKMKDAFSKSFKEGDDKVILIGSDCPTLSTSIIEKAFRLLDENDVVFGPSQDGGYYLIGMSSYYPEVLEEITWSSELVMQQTEERAAIHNLSLAKLVELNDIDNENDWNEYLKSVDSK